MPGNPSDMFVSEPPHNGLACPAWRISGDALPLDNTANPMPRDLSARGVEHNHDSARTTVIFGIAGDVPRDPRAVLARYFGRDK
ncbi:hypothetical protein ACVWWP_004553 [Bradyrhizobium sp. LM3.6]